MRLPQVILLNGTSSAGKSSIAKVLQERLLPTVYLNFSIDSVLYALPGSVLKKMMSGGDLSDLDYAGLIRGYYASAAALASTGQTLILDDAVTDAVVAAELLAALGPYCPMVIAVRCDLEELKRREKARGDRTVGEAEWQYQSVHTLLTYDFEVDTTLATPDACAENILASIADRR